jgi:hypothetical protein
MTSSSPPPEVAAAAEVVNTWLREREAGAVKSEPKKMSAAEKLDWARSHDQSKMPAWKDPRS